VVRHGIDAITVKIAGTRGLGREITLAVKPSGAWWVMGQWYEATHEKWQWNLST